MNLPIMKHTKNIFQRNQVEEFVSNFLLFLQEQCRVLLFLCYGS